MVDTYGRWIYERNTPEIKKCDLDRVADIILDKGYKPLTGIENLTIMLVLYFENMLNESEMEWPDGDHLEELLTEFIEESGGLIEFDYVA